MTTFPNSPRLIKGALVAMDPANPQGNRIEFQYNPDTMTRRLEARSMGGGDNTDRSEAFRLTGPPKETITLNIELDAADQLEQGDTTVAASGLSPKLAALELLLYPKSTAVIANAAMAQAGMLEVIPPEAPMILFVWGASRVLPVRLTGFSITEEAFDPSLNPIRAKIDLTLNVLSYADLKITHPGYNLFMAYQIAKETMVGNRAISGSASGSSALSGGLSFSASFKFG